MYAINCVDQVYTIINKAVCQAIQTFFYIYKSLKVLTQLVLYMYLSLKFSKSHTCYTYMYIICIKKLKFCNSKAAVIHVYRLLKISCRDIKGLWFFPTCIVLNIRLVLSKMLIFRVDVLLLSWKRVALEKNFRDIRPAVVVTLSVFEKRKKKKRKKRYIAAWGESRATAAFPFLLLFPLLILLSSVFPLFIYTG